ncbi:MAG: tRNA pseudouridine(13) synthase TruD [Woeseiaceae bacterium]
MPATDTILPDWVRAHGKPLVQGLIKQSPQDFHVEEVLGFVPSGDGEHDYLLIEKTDANTNWVARQLAQHANVAVRDIGFAGMKDRRAVTSQWFSARRPDGSGTDWEALALPGVRILEQQRNNRKLRRGAHSANLFRIVVRLTDVVDESLPERLAQIRTIGVPNYFGPQRFGRDGNNLKLANAIFAGKRVKRDQRSIAISAARSFLFNEVLSARVSAGNWNEILDGEPVNLDGTASFFVPEENDDALQARQDAFDVHPTGPLWGRGESECSGAAAEYEKHVGDENSDVVSGLEKVGARCDRRALRLRLQEFEWEISNGVIEIRFRLGKGSFATTVLREFMEPINA